MLITWGLGPAAYLHAHADTRFLHRQRPGLARPSGRAFRTDDDPRIAQTGAVARPMGIGGGREVLRLPRPGPGGLVDPDRPGGARGAGPGGDGLEDALGGVACRVYDDVAAFVVHGGDPLGDKELALLYLVCFSAVAALGGGAWSLDAALARRK